MSDDDKTQAAQDAEDTQSETLDVELDTAKEHLQQEGRDHGKGEDLDGELPTEDGGEEPPEGSPEHDRGIISGS